MRKTETLTPYQLDWLKEGSQAITERLEWAAKTIKTADPSELSYKQAKYDLRVLKNLNK
jgi:hypothetical protein